MECIHSSNSHLFIRIVGVYSIQYSGSHLQTNAKNQQIKNTPLAKARKLWHKTNKRKNKSINKQRQSEATFPRGYLLLVQVVGVEGVRWRPHRRVGVVAQVALRWSGFALHLRAGQHQWGGSVRLRRHLLETSIDIYSRKSQLGFYSSYSVILQEFVSGPQARRTCFSMRLSCRFLM